jgi:hypothetical protein
MPGEDLDFNSREVVLRADLSSVDELDCVWAPIRFIMNGPRMPRPGERVVLVDTGGTGTCIGRVMSVSGWEACIRPDWATLTGAGKPPLGHMLPPQSFGRGPAATA